MNIDFRSKTIRGILVAFFVYQCLWWANRLWAGIASQSLRDSVLRSVFLLPLLLAVLGLLRRPARSAHAVFALLILMSASGCLSAWFVFSYAHRHSVSVHLVQIFYFAVEPLVTVLVTILAFVYQHRLHPARLPA